MAQHAGMNINQDALMTAAALRLNELRREAAAARLARQAVAGRRFRITLYLPLLHWSLSFVLSTT